MASMTFQVNDASTSGSNPAVWVTITENGDGTLSFSITQQGGIVGDLRGLFFDLHDESLIGSLTTDAQTSDFRQGNDTIKDLGDGANMNGLLGSDAASKVAGAEGNGFDVGIEVGSAGIGKDDIQSYEFTLGSSVRGLTLQDFANVDFGVRLTSVGTIGGSRDDSSKILEKTSAAIDAKDDSACVDENSLVHGNVLDNDTAGLPATDVVTVTGWSGGALGETIQLDNAAGATLTLDASGHYILDASTADALSEGEHLTYTFAYDAKSQNQATSWSTDGATFTICVDGKNDGPDAQDDNAGSIAESGSLSGDVTGNDSDIDRLDTHTWALVDGSFNGLGSLTFNADGTWSYDTSGAYDDLVDGDVRDLSFSYVMTDNHGASDTAVVSFQVQGAGSITPPPSTDPAQDFLFNHGGQNDDHGFFPQSGHDNTAEGFTDNDTLKLAGYGDILSVTVDEGDFGLGDAAISDTQFVIEMDGNGNSTRTEDTGYLVDYTGLTADQIDVTGTGNQTDSYELLFV